MATNCRTELALFVAVLIPLAAGARDARAQCQTRIIATDAGANVFGFSTSLSGNVALTGAVAFAQSTGAVYVHRFDGFEWLPEQRLGADDGAVGDNFGFAVSIDGNAALVGAYRADGDRGAAYVFRFDGTTWIQEATLVASPRAVGDYFGNAVSIHDGLAVVGAYRADAAYVFRFDGSAWVREAKLTAAATGEYFGDTVAVQGGVVAVGAPFADTFFGKVYVYRFDGTSWVQQATLSAPDGVFNDRFGSWVSISGPLLVAAAPLRDNLRGAAYVYAFDGSSWGYQTTLTASDGKSDDAFGETLTVDGDTIVVGAPRSIYEPTVGAAYVYRFDGASWSEQLKLQSGSRNGFSFGQCVTVSGPHVLVGAWGEDAFAGAVYAFPVRRAQCSNYGSGWPGTNGIPSLSCSGSPSLGATINLQIDNSLGTPTLGVLLVDPESASITTNLGGTLLVGSQWVVYPILLPGSGLTASVTIPGECSLLEQLIYAQVLEIDPGASQGVSFTPGLMVAIGYP